MQPSKTGNRAVPKVFRPDDPLDHFRAFVEIVRILRNDCPWDKKQTHVSLMPLLVEEVYEAAEAAETGDYAEFSKELGDILLHVVMNAVIAEESGAFAFADVVRRTSEKLVHRHPHVFGEAPEAKSAEEVRELWERQKMKEGRSSALEGVPKHLPALLRAQRVQEKAANIGFDWDKRADVWAKVEEEIAELKQELFAGASGEAATATNSEPRANQAAVEEEFGDLLFALVNAARFWELNAEQSLQSATNKFIRRFQRIEQMAQEQGSALSAMTLAEMDALWDAAKREG